METEMERKPVTERISELRSETGDQQGIHHVYGTMVSEGYQPEEVIMYTAEDMPLS